MMGAIVGDIVGSVYEWHNIKTKEFPLFREHCKFTDDTVMTVAVAEAILNGGGKEDFISAMKKYGRMYPDAGYGGRFRRWLFSEETKPYNSWGNGAAMRVSPCGWMMDCGFFCRTGCWPQNGQELARRSASVTHNHPEGEKAAMAVADAIFIARLYRGKWIGDYGTEPLMPTLDDCKSMVRKSMEEGYQYDLSKSLDEIRPSFSFDESCQGTVPPAIIAFLESESFEDAIRNAVSLGGDSDTIAAITGSIAEAAYGIPKWILDEAWKRLDDPLKDVCRRWRKSLKEVQL